MYGYYETIRTVQHARSPIQLLPLFELDGGGGGWKSQSLSDWDAVQKSHSSMHRLIQFIGACGTHEVGIRYNARQRKEINGGLYTWAICVAYTTSHRYTRAVSQIYGTVTRTDTAQKSETVFKRSLMCFFEIINCTSTTAVAVATTT